jgi:hypothetical protein
MFIESFRGDFGYDPALAIAEVLPNGDFHGVMKCYLLFTGDV